MSTNTLEKINELLIEGVKLKTDERLRNCLTPDFDETMEKLEELKSLSEYGIFDASDIIRNEFEELEISKYQNWKAYLISKNVNAARYFNKSFNKIKTNRTTSKTNKCRYCGSTTIIENNKIKCINPSCGHIMNARTANEQTIFNDKMKHSNDKLKMISGLKNPPKKIMNIKPYIDIWLRNLRYIYDWLDYKETHIKSKRSNSKHEWLASFKCIYQREHGKCFPMDLLDIPNNKDFAWSYLEYKMLITEFYSMLTECERLNNPTYTTTNMTALSDDVIFEIFGTYRDTHENLPLLQETFKYKNEIYQIGNFINVLRLNNEEDNIKHEIETLFKTKIYMPGLMFNFISHPKEKVERHIFTESYSYIIHVVFNISFDDTMIDNETIDKIIGLIENFDEFIVQRTKTNVRDRKQNSKLYTCKLKCILQLPYFNKYSNICKYIPIKSDEASGQIEMFWLEYISTNEGKKRIEEYEK